MFKPIFSSVVALLLGAFIGNSWVSSGSTTATAETSELLNQFELLEQRLEYEALERKKLEQTLAQEQEICSDSEKAVEVDTGIQMNPGNDHTAADNSQLSFLYNDYQEQIDELMEAGFGLDQAQMIAGLESQVQQTIFSSRFENRTINPRGLVLEFQNMLRGELGDDQYALYLETRGRPTNVEVMEIVDNSAGMQAGLLNGDKILSYDGERVFSILDLQRLTQEGIEGQTIIMEVDRDGIPVTLAIPRGTIGISSGDFGFRNRGRN